MVTMLDVARRAGVTKQTVSELAAKPELLAELREASEKVAAILHALASATDPNDRVRIVERDTALLVKNANRQRVLLEKLGLYGSAEE